MNVYVAGRTTDLKRVRQVQYLCKQAGWNITYDWTQNIDEQSVRAEADGTDAHMLATYALNDVDGVRRADVVIVMCNPALIGTLIEVGMAIAWGKRIWLCGDTDRDSVFFYLPNFEKFTSELDLFDHIVAEGRRYNNLIQHINAPIPADESVQAQERA